MTVYFARLISDPMQIKIGTANNIETRLEAVARAVGPLHFFASMAGGVATERQVQARFVDHRIEGEWFRSTDELEHFITVAATPENKEFRVQRKTWSTKAQQPLARREDDARCAQALLLAITERYPRETSITRSLELAFNELHAVNPCWSRRRVRALRELRGLRVDVFEIVDMLTLLEIPRARWADWISPKKNVDRRAA